MPLSLVPAMVLRETIKPFASNETIAVTAVSADDVAADIAGNLFEPDRAAAACHDLAIRDANVAAGKTMDQPAPGRQRNALPPSSVIPLRATLSAPSPNNNRGAADEGELGGAAHADQLRAARQTQHAGCDRSPGGNASGICARAASSIARCKALV